MKKLLLILLSVLLFVDNASATHLRAGNITYKYTGTASQPYKYEITVTTYTDWAGPGSTDNCSIVVHFGDGDTAVVNRSNGSTYTLCGSIPDGELLTPDTRKNVYTVEHIYHGPFTYTIWVEISARNKGVCNITNGPPAFTPVSSDVFSFYLESELVINPFLGPNNIQLLNDPIDKACVGTCFEHNPEAYDADGDSLYYSLSPSYANGIPIPGWVYPPNMNASSIDPQTGEFRWCSPSSICQYNVAIVIKQYRYLPSFHQWYYMGSVLRDMQITVESCSNIPPQIQHVNDTCVIAGTNLSFTVSAADAESSAFTLEVAGAPFITSPSATFTSSSGGSSASGTFSWTPGCSQVQLSSYLVTFKANDNDPATPMVDYESMFIKVIAPPVTGLTAAPAGSSILLNWNPALCDTASDNPLVKYLVYRKDNCAPWQPGPCETGVPAYTGYTLIGSNPYNDTDFTDNNGGSGLVIGTDYSYIIVAVYFDGSQSVASLNVCAKLVRDVPAITNVSVMTTSASGGTIWTHWLKPLGSASDLDTVANPPPYESRLMLASGTGYSLIASYAYPAYWQMTDTGFVSTLSTTVQQTYKVEFYSNGNLVGSSPTASSVYLSSLPGDKKINLSWTESVPWNNYKYFIYRESSAVSGIFNLIDSTITPNYVDTGLVNEVEYCYRILSKGEYSDASLPRPLWNYSEIRCDVPVDLIPPCQPKFDVSSDCKTFQNTVTWTNPNTYCSDDAVQINIYYAATVNDPLQLIYSTTDLNDSSYTLPIHLFENLVPSVAGCFALTAVDSALSPNESPVINRICIDNCPEYELPNVFTPNGDGKNDLFTPLPGYRYVKDVDIHIYDRWGLEMFSTSDKNILWDGTNAATGNKCTDGVYFYVCTVNEIRVTGIRPRVLKGFVQLIREGQNPDY